MKSIAATGVTLLIAFLFVLVRGLPSSINPLSALAVIGVVWLVIRGILAVLGGRKHP
jgi:hypothetical protein